jgi:hypothetical protein
MMEQRRIEEQLRLEEEMRRKQEEEQRRREWEVFLLHFGTQIMKEQQRIRELREEEQRKIREEEMVGNKMSHCLIVDAREYKENNKE